MASTSHKTINRLPLSQIVKVLRSGPASVTLSPRVRELNIRYIAKNAGPGPGQFLRQYAPSLSYANPGLPINVHRIRDPRSKHKDPNSPDAEAMKTRKWDGHEGTTERPQQEIIIDFHDAHKQVLGLDGLNGEQILAQLLTIAAEQSTVKSLKGEEPLLAIEGETETEAGVEGSRTQV